MEQKTTDARPASTVPRSRTEAIARALHVAVANTHVAIARSTKGDHWTFPEGPELANHFLDVARALDLELARRGLRVLDDGEAPREVRSERRRVAAELLRARRAAQRDFDQRGPEECMDGVWIEVQSKHLDELAEKLARGER